MNVEIENRRVEVELGNIKFGGLFVDPVNEEMGVLMRINPNGIDSIEISGSSAVIAVSLEDGEVYGFGPEDRVVNLVEGKFTGRY